MKGAEMQEKRAEQNSEILKTAMQGAVLAVLFLLIAYLTVSSFGIAWPWWPGITGTLVCILFSLALAAISLLGHRAYQFQAMVAAMSAGWTLPLLAAGFALTSWSVSQTGWVLLLCAVNVTASYRSALRRLSVPQFQADNTGRLDATNGFWNISKPLFADRDPNRGKNIAKLLIPLGSGFGAVLYRILTLEGSWFSAGLMFVLAFLLTSWAGTHAAAAVYIRRLEARLRKAILV